MSPTARSTATSSRSTRPSRSCRLSTRSAGSSASGIRKRTDMPDSTPRVAVYLDFDNIVMSWYDRVHGRNSYSRDRQRIAENNDAEVAERLAAATVDVGAIIDYAAS